jgi:hypothetical protein
MASPTVPVVDTFPNVENPLSSGGAWRTPWQTGTSVLKADGASAFSAASYGSASRADIEWSDGEAYVDSPSAGDCYMGIRIPASHVSDDFIYGYVLNWVVAGSGQISLYRYDANAATLLSTVNIGASVAGGDQLWLLGNGSRISAYYKGALILTGDDATYTQGIAGLVTSQAAATGFDNFGSGALARISSFQPRRMPLGV